MASPGFAFAWILAAAAVAPPPGWDRLEGCVRAEGPHNDGDSIEVLHAGKHHVFRLYFVDCIETNPNSAGRRAAQGSYFGVTDQVSALSYAEKAKEFTRAHLQRPFTIHTNWTPVTAGSDNPSIRAFVELSDGNDLGQLLVENGLAIIRSGPALSNHPDGRTRSQILKQLREAETLARVRGRGAWGPAARIKPSPPVEAGSVIEATRTADLRARAGREVVVRGSISRVASLPDGRITFVNFEGTTRGDFVAIIREDSLPKIEAAFQGDLQTAMSGKQVELRGVVTLYRGNPQIEVDDPAQISVLN